MNEERSDQPIGADGSSAAGLLTRVVKPRPLTLSLWFCCLLMIALGILGRSSGADASETPPGESSLVRAAGDSVFWEAERTGTEALPADGQEAQGQPRIRVPQGGLDTGPLERARGLLGMAILLALAWAVSVDRRNVMWRVVAWGMSLQVVFALVILRLQGEIVFDFINRVVLNLLGFTVDGASFLFGNLVNGNVPVGLGSVETGEFSEIPGQVANIGAQFAFGVLPTIIFFSSLITVLYHLGVMQLFVRGVAWVMQRTMRTSGAETTSAAANIFVGQTEAPLMVKPFVGQMTRSELMAVMTGGFATVAGGVMAAQVLFLVAYFPDVAGHLLAASVMSAPAALVVAKLMYPEDGTPVTANQLAIHVERRDVNVIDAAARGATDGLRLSLNVGAMLLAFIALIALFNGLLGWVGGSLGFADLTLESILGWCLSPLAWLMGVPWEDARQVAGLLGIKTVLNEFYAYLQLAGTLAEGDALQSRSIIIATYALSGFANFSSIAIQLGGIGGIAPERRSDLARIGLRAMVGGTIAAFLTATIAGMIL